VAGFQVLGKHPYIRLFQKVVTSKIANLSLKILVTHPWQNLQ